MRGSKQLGFTLIELVVVIVILGVLAAFAVPRFMGMEGKARIATVQALQGSVRSASAMAHGVWLADGTNAASMNIEGQTVNFTRGYPNRTTLDRLLQDTSGFTYAAAAGRFTKNGATTPANCSVQFSNATVVGGVIVPPVITAVTTGC